MSAAGDASRILIAQTVLPLPGGLDDTPLFNSNSPEIVTQSGVLLSTFPPQGRAHPQAHLNYPLTGHFNVFFHHIADALKAQASGTLHIGLLVGNASEKQVRLSLLKAVSHATKPDAPFVVLDSVTANNSGRSFAGPGDRVMLDLIRNHKQNGWDECITLAPGQTKVIFSLPIPVQRLLHRLNGRTGFLELHSDGPVFLAMLSAFSDERGFGRERQPELNDWIEVLQTKPLVQPRDKTPTPPGAPGELIYGRVAGVAAGSTWKATLTNDIPNSRLSLSAGDIVSFPLSTVPGGTLGTNQIQSASMLVRYPDTSYQAHGNYSVLYDLDVPIHNSHDSNLIVGLTFQSPVKTCNEPTSLRFHRQPPNMIMFRGSIKFAWKDKSDQLRTEIIHLVQKQGQMQDPLVEFELSARETLDVNFQFRYPADCTPPHVLTISAKSGKEDLNS